MIVVYEDEYGEELLKINDTDLVPDISDSVIINEEEWRVKTKTFYPSQNVLVILLTQNVSRIASVKDSTEGRLNEVKSSILELANKQQVTEKKVRAVREETASIRKHINTQIQKDRKNDT